MNIIKLISQKSEYLRTSKIPTIAFLGDSVTQGCFEIYQLGEGIQTIFDPAHAYHAYVAKILATLFPSAPVNIINAGISGDRASGGLSRLTRDVLSHSPDLCVVCFGLNDSGSLLEGIDRYRESLAGIFKELTASGCEVIFMTPNMMCTKLSPHVTEESFKKVANTCSKRQNDGIMDAYIEIGKQTAEKYGVKVCDVYGKWKRMAEYGVDITELLANYINHPTRDMNYLFAYSLVETMFE